VRIGQRLLLAVAPGIIGVVAVAALAYWGEREREVPALVVIIVAAVTLMSLWFAWVTTHDLAHRIERLGKLVEARDPNPTAHPERSLLAGLAREALSRLSGSGRAGADELDPVERLIARYDAELARLDEQRREADDRVAEAHAEASRLLYDAGDRIAKRLDEVRLPLHVLLDAPFGELNENQEELIGAARTAADAASAEARSVRDLGALEVARGGRRDRVMSGDLIRSIMPLIQAEARRGKVNLDWEQAPALPAVIGDRARLQEAVREILARVVRAAESGSTVKIAATSNAEGVTLTVSPVRNVAASELAIESRVLQTLGSTLEIPGDRLNVVLPVFGS
jgi:signal transduction histidine kinase